MATLQAVTLGCSKNTVDTEHLLAVLCQSGYEILPDDWQGRADVLLLDTCGFIGDAKKESVDAIMDAVRRKRSGDVGRIVVFGCLSQRYAAQLEAEIPEVDRWLGARDLGEVLRALDVQIPSRFTSRYMENRPYAYLKISEGCDRRCSYCAIPFIRGPHRSVPVEILLEEAENLVSGGVKELILIAQDSTYYGLDLYGRRALAELIRRLSAIDGLERIRIHYSYPADFPEDVLLEMRDNPKVCKYLDIPLQHISDKVLKEMHRGVDGDWTRRLVARLRAEIPGVALRTTMIVGHPGEGPAEFGELLDFVKGARFERLGAFTYSEEEGTWGAAHLKDDVPKEEKARRMDELMTLQAELSLQYNRSRIGSEVRVLADAVMKDGTLVCRSEYESPEVDGEILVRGGDASMVGEFLKARITSADEYDLGAELT